MQRSLWILATAGLGLCFSFTSACGGDDNTDSADEVGDGDGDTGEGDVDEVNDNTDSADEVGDGDGDTGEGDVVEVNEDIDADTTWTADKTYVLTDLITVNGATLTIEPGTIIRGTAGSALVIEKDAMLMADGTADAPIVFTSNQESPIPGDWGGLVLIGSATANIGTGQAEGFPVPPTYGGSDDSHNCGTLRYVRVEYAGYAISEGNELNGITFYACGSQTTVSYVQSHMGLDDGIEMFGGNFDADHIVVTGASDDSLDMDQGYSGTVQYVFLQQNATVGDNCYEISNQATDFDATPKTSPVFCNATCIGSGGTGEKSKGITVKEGTEGEWYASIVTNTTLEAALLADEATYGVATSGGIALQNNIFFANGTPAFTSGADSLDDAGWEAWVMDAANMNMTSDPGLGTDWGSPNPVPSGDVAGSGTVGAGCDATGYVGAVDPTGSDWTSAAWINYTP